jgi:hypothetical protein
MYGSATIRVHVATAAGPLRGRLPLERPTIWFWTARSIVPSSFGQTDRDRPSNRIFHNRDVITVPFLSMRLVAGGLKYPIARIMEM